MSLSVNTNVGAMVALQALNATNADLANTQNIISTGKKINSVKDNGAIWAIANNQNATAVSLDAVKNSLQRGQSTIDVATNAGSSVSDLLTQMKEKALEASDTSLDSTSRAALNTDFQSLRDQITKVVANASFNGTNLINSSTGFTALASADGTVKLTVAGQSLSLGGTILTSSVSATATIGTASTASAMVASLTSAISNVGAAMAKLGTASNSLDRQLTFVGKLQDTLNAGVSNLVDADLASESAKLTALQTKQQLGVQALSIANSSTSTLLSLFR